MSFIENVMNNKYDNHVLPFFWQKDNISDSTIIDYIDKMYKSDIREFCIESRPFTGFLQKAWWKRLDLIIKESKKRNMRIWILDDYHFPTGYANGEMKKHPNYRKRVLKHHIVNAIGPFEKFALHIHQPFPTDPTAQFLGAIAIQGNRKINLGNDIKGDLLYFDLPDGRWDIDVMLISDRTDVAPDYINMLDRNSCKLLIDTVYQPHYEKYKDEFGKTIMGFFSDEPGFQNEKGHKSDSLIGKDMPLPWSKELANDLEKKWGQDYIKELPDLWHDIDERTHVIRYDYMNIITNIYQKNFSEQIGDWCRNHNVEYIGHIIEDRESHARLGVGPGHYFRSMSGQSMAGSDIISNQLMPGMDKGYNTWARGKWDGEFFHYLIGKLTSSLAHISPQMNGNSMCEVFGAYGWHEGMPLMKWIIDHQVAQGINYFVPHAFSPAPFPDSDCPPHFYGHGNNPQFRYFGKLMKYTNQLATMFSNGKFIPKAAVLYHAEAEWVGKYMSSQKPARLLSQHQVSFDVIPSDAFNKINKFNSKLKQGLNINNNYYPLLIIPYSQYINSDVYNFIISNNNTKIIFIDDYPEGFTDKSQALDLMRLRQNCDCMKLDQLEKFVDGNDLNDLKFSVPQPKLLTYHYQKENIDEFFVINENASRTIQTTVKKSDGSDLYRIDLLTNTYSKLVDGYLKLEPLESCIITNFYNENMKISKERITENEIEITNSPRVSFATASEYPKFTSSKLIKEYKDISYDINPGFSGTIRYEITFFLEDEIRNCNLNLGKVYEIAEVILNNKKLGVRFCEPYVFDNCTFQKGENKLIIDVTNTLDKAIYEKHSAAVVIKPSGLINPVKIEF